MRIKQLETTMFQNLYIMTMGGSQTNLQIQQQANVLHILQIQQMNLSNSFFTPRPAPSTIGFGKPHYMPPYPNFVYPNLGVPMNMPYGVPYNIPQAPFHPPPSFDCSVPPPNMGPPQMDARHGLMGGHMPPPRSGCSDPPLSMGPPSMDVRHVPMGGHVTYKVPPSSQQINSMLHIGSDNQASVQSAETPLRERPLLNVMSESGPRVEGTKNTEHDNMQSEGPTSGIRNSLECRGINGMETDTQLIDKQRAKGVAVNFSSSHTLRNNSDVTSEIYNDTNIASKGSNEKEVGSKNRHQSF